MPTLAPGQNFVPSLREYARVWGVSAKRLRPGQVVKPVDLALAR